MEEDKLTFSMLSNSIIWYWGWYIKSIVKFLAYQYSRCVSIDELKRTFNTSNFFVQEMSWEKSNLVSFHRNLGDDYDFENFGEVFIMYSWIRGVNPLRCNKLFEIFYKVNLCMHFLIQYKFIDTILNEHNIRKSVP